ncbi:MAG TPA: threonine--tRNA ligase, partial [Kofleriaceae bacterium]|nr:threonine--tRNA ligase [Kofleriaceae bacterium]
MESELDPDDHRALAARLDLLHFQDEAPGMVFWHPRGYTLYRLLEEEARRHVQAGGYREVRGPQVLRRAIWEQSGHWDHFRDGMFAFGEGAAEAALKPVSCPGHLLLARRAAPSWRDLPLRYAEMGLVHRDEPDGSLHGLMRLRQFTQDDGHVFCTDEQIAGEVERFCRDLPAFYRRFGFDDVAVALSTRPADRAGDDAWWDQAEAALEAAVRGLGVPFTVQPGGGAFYGPKLEFVLRDRRGRAWQLGTIQLDLVMPRRFDLRYVDRDGERRHPAMLHRALYGSIERFLGVLLEHHGATLPAWLAPEQVAVLPVGAEQDGCAREAAARLAAAGLRVRVDDGGVALST